MTKQKNRGDDYINWYQNATREEHKLKDLMLHFQNKYFSDMTYNKIDKRLTKCMVDGKEMYSTPDIFICLGEWKIVIKNLRKSGGLCNKKKNLILIKKSKSEKDKINTLLHEMIHAYEFILEEYPINLREMLILKLYSKLKNQIKNLNSFIYLDNHFELQVHSILFLLKSLDLDLRLKYSLGTIYAYGRTDFFK